MAAKNGAPNERELPSAWPALPFSEWRETCATLQLWTQVVGKIRLVQTPWINHSWHVTLYVTARGLTTSLIPYGERAFQVDFDFIAHELILQSSDGETRKLALESQSVASFYRRVMTAMKELDLAVEISLLPNELTEAIPFDRDEKHSSYDPEYAQRFWRVLLQTHRVFQKFRARFIGKCSPVHFFWGSFDLAVTRFSGRTAPPHPGGVPHLPNEVAREAYSHEVSSLGFWPGSDASPHAIFYSYAYPSPDGFAKAKVTPAAASFNETLREFVLPYDEVRNASSPEAALLDFAQSTYEAAVNLAQWNRAELEAANAPLPSPHRHP